MSKHGEQQTKKLLKQRGWGEERMLRSQGKLLRVKVISHTSKSYMSLLVIMIMSYIIMAILLHTAAGMAAVELSSNFTMIMILF